MTLDKNREAWATNGCIKNMAEGECRFLDKEL